MAQFVKRLRNDVAILDISGKITIGAGDVQLRENIRETLDAGNLKILLNLANVTTIDSSGIGELVSAYTTASNRGGRLKLLNLPSKIQDVLMITQLITVFETFDNEDEAVDSF